MLASGKYIAIRQLDMASEPPIRQLSLSLTRALFLVFCLDLGGLEVLELPRRQHGPSLLEAPFTFYPTVMQIYSFVWTSSLSRVHECSTND